MDRFVSPARLEWWANSSTCFGEFDIDITVVVDEAGAWHASGEHSLALDADAREGWYFLMGMDPHFSLAFPGEDRGSLMVRVDEMEDGGLVLREAPDWDGSVSVPFGL
ncbi:hypothetical protein ACFYST_20965 [Kitasatospora sp. NPDC004614]|uniref:hypothetical protein n=1 Tax=unclassified Kitasatospora TaxID=2633591 RepID=UPI0036A3D0FE